LAQANETLQKAVATPTPVPTATLAPAPSGVSGFFSGRNLPYIIGLVVLALVVVSFFFTRRTEGIDLEKDLDKVMADEDRGLLEKEGGKSDLGPLGKDDRGRAGYSAAKPGEPGYSPKTNYLDRYKDKE
ncbi:MAG: hypothetical protein NTY90_04655, partial [Candidatus Micrarchaeota archaeon]|nr:hypothetical protein [Candidatus Micrarchaeota archaeon]